MGDLILPLVGKGRRYTSPAIDSSMPRGPLRACSAAKVAGKRVQLVNIDNAGQVSTTTGRQAARLQAFAGSEGEELQGR
ncbi:MAG: hypothetical protein CME40_11175 [Haliea sp.]|nr:hypothetical protein [Haliea sp.]